MLERDANARAADADARIAEYNRILDQCQSTGSQVLRLAESLVPAPRPVAAFAMHEGERTGTCLYDDGSMMLRKLTPQGNQWFEGQPLPGTPAAILAEIRTTLVTLAGEIAKVRFPEDAASGHHVEDAA